MASSSFWRILNTPVLPSPKANSFCTASRTVCIEGVFGRSSRFDLTRSRVALNSFSIASSVSLLLADSAAIMSAAIRLPLAEIVATWETVRAASVASSADTSAAPRIAFRRVCASSIAGPAAPTKVSCALRSASYCLSCSAPVSSRSRAADTRLWVASSMLLAVSRSAVAICLSAPSSMISPSLAMASCWMSFTLLVRSFSASSEGDASRPGPCAASVALCEASCRLAERRGMSRPLRSIMVAPR
ncbi:hypothetical protein ACVIU4_000810 [Bradyrhizobium barranii subsp. barranii]